MSCSLAISFYLAANLRWPTLSLSSRYFRCLPSIFMTVNTTIAYTIEMIIIFIIVRKILPKWLFVLFCNTVYRSVYAYFTAVCYQCMLFNTIQTEKALDRRLTSKLTKSVSVLVNFIVNRFVGIRWGFKWCGKTFWCWQSVLSLLDDIIFEYGPC